MEGGNKRIYARNCPKSLIYTLSRLFVKIICLFLNSHLCRKYKERSISEFKTKQAPDHNTFLHLPDLAPSFGSFRYSCTLHVCWWLFSTSWIDLYTSQCEVWAFSSSKSMLWTRSPYLLRTRLTSPKYNEWLNTNKPELDTDQFVTLIIGWMLGISCI